MPDVTVTGPALTIDDVLRWRSRASTAYDRAVADVVAGHIDDVAGATEWTESVDIELRSGERLEINIGRLERSRAMA